MIFDDRAWGWDAFGEVERVLDDMGRLFSRRLTPEPALNVWANDDSVMLTAPMPGLDPESIAVTAVGDSVTIAGKRESPADGDGEWLRRERTDTSFTRSVQLPFAVDPDRTEARYAKGVLYLALRRPEEQKPKKIAVKTA